MKEKGYFITFEGIDGSGKTTQLKKTTEYLRGKSIVPLILREPGSTPLSERVRRILLNKKLEINAVSEFMLYVAARAELVKDILAPALAKGNIVLCDRFYDSTTAYQGYGRGIDVNLIKKVNELGSGTCPPDLTFLIDVDYKTSLSRRKKKRDRLESESKAFFNKVRNGFLQIALKEKVRVKVIDGNQPVAAVFEEVKYWLDRKLKIL
jgi:dTMP kinase